jgi:hypothetical protein
MVAAARTTRRGGGGTNKSQSKSIAIGSGNDDDSDPDSQEPGSSSDDFDMSEDEEEDDVDENLQEDVSNLTSLRLSSKFDFLFKRAVVVKPKGKGVKSKGRTTKVATSRNGKKKATVGKQGKGTS